MCAEYGGSCAVAQAVSQPPELAAQHLANRVRRVAAAGSAGAQHRQEHGAPPGSCALCPRSGWIPSRPAARASHGRAPQSRRSAARASTARQHPAGIVRIVRGQPQLAPGPDHPGEVRQRLPIDDPPLVVPQLRPRVGEQDEGPLQAAPGAGPSSSSRASSLRTRTLASCSASMAPQQLGDPIDERLDTQKADVRLPRRLRRQMLASAEADLQPQGSRRPVEQGQRIERLRRS